MANQSLSEILAGFNKSPYGNQGVSPSAQNALLLSALSRNNGQTQQSNDPYASLTSDERALLEQAYPEPKQIAVPAAPKKRQKVFAEIVAGLAGPDSWVMQDYQRKLKAHDLAQAYNEQAPIKAHSAKALAALRIIEHQKNTGQSGLAASAHEAEKASKADALYMNQLRKDAAEKFGIKGAYDLSPSQLHDAIAEARSNQQFQATSEKAAGLSFQQKREARIEAAAGPRRRQPTSAQVYAIKGAPIRIKRKEAERSLASLEKQRSDAYWMAGGGVAANADPTVVAIDGEIAKMKVDLGGLDTQLEALSIEALNPPQMVVPTTGTVAIPPPKKKKAK